MGNTVYYLYLGTWAENPDIPAPVKSGETVIDENTAIIIPMDTLEEAVKVRKEHCPHAIVVSYDYDENGDINNKADYIVQMMQDLPPGQFRIDF